MPKFNFKAVPLDAVRNLSTGFLDDMEALLQVPRENLSIEVTHSTYVRDGAVDVAVPVVEVEWLMRPKELQDAAVDIIARHLKTVGHDRVDVVFTILDTERFYRRRP